MMTLKDCTKAELLWIIDRLRNRGLYRLDTIIAIALNDLEYQREQKKLDEACLLYTSPSPRDCS